MCSNKHVGRLNLDDSPYDQDTYWGRFRHYFQRTNPFHLLTSSDTLEDSKCLYLKYRCGEPLAADVTEDEVWRAKALFESAYNPETGEKINFWARPAAFIPVNMVLAGGMMAYYKSTPGVVFWQWLNQTYNTWVGYKNKGSDDEITNTQLITSYVVATGTAIGTALGLNRLLVNSPALVGRFVPFVAVAAAHCVGTPLLKAQILKNGTPIYDDCHNKLGYSKNAAYASISDSIMNKIFIAVPPMLLTPLVMNYLERRGTLCRYPWVNFPAHVGFAGLFLTFLSPLAYALYAQRPHMPYKHLETDLREALCKKFYDRPPKFVYYEQSV
ncbi:sideroflexin-1-3 [Tribolium castaneum]|uniref:Sideroflexin-3-like Protein n=1 Tax=Tribolium castaneum TaxID=7070 RepID=D6X3C4_TRICA|nr:PREDICTED: sideroflexin-3 [Tribolium castaneum]EFA10705.1 Sideroflexin-3-like Protein [Tribolium castaneum]|eukprot:XP_973802.1 PREDICTED: sideroflexin-3 [Tribolium castaneum]